METIEGNFQIHCGKKSTKMSDKKHALLKIFFLQKSIRDYLKPYGHGKFPGTSLKCRWEDRIDKQNWCHVSRRKLIDWSHDVQCSRSENFGFALAQPCIILKPTKIFDWEPEPYYNITEVQQLPQMPKRLKNEISKTWDKHCKVVPHDECLLQLQLVSCSVVLWLYNNILHHLLLGTLPRQPHPGHSRLYSAIFATTFIHFHFPTLHH